MRIAILSFLLITATLRAADPPVGTAAVEALLDASAAAGAIVPVKDNKTGKVIEDAKLGTPRFAVPDLAKLAKTVAANKALMANEKSRKALIGCTKLAEPESARGWVELLRAVGQEHDDKICLEISYHVAAVHGLLPGSARGFADLKTLINKAITAEALIYRKSNRPGSIAAEDYTQLLMRPKREILLPGLAGTRELARLKVGNASILNAILADNKDLFGPDLESAMVNLSLTRVDHTPVLWEIAETTKSPLARAYAAEFAARDLRYDLKASETIAELEKALAAFTELYDTPSRARVLIELAQLRNEFGEGDLAIDHLNEAYRILDLVHSGQHPGMALCRRLKSEIYRDRGEIQQSLVTYLQAIELYAKGPQAPEQFADTIECMRLFAGINLRMGHIDEAREGLQDCLFVLDEVRKTLPDADTNPHRARTLRDLGLLELKRNHLDDAKSRLDEALNLQIRREGTTHPETIATVIALGQVCAARGEPGQSELFSRQAAIFLNHQYGWRNALLVKVWSDRSAIHVAQGRLQEAAREIDLGLKSALPNTVKGPASAEDFLPIRESVILLARRGDLSLQYYDRGKDERARLDSLKYALENFIKAEKVFERQRGRMPGTEDRIVAGDEAPDFFAGQLGCFVRLAKLDSAGNDPKTAFAIVDRASARSLIDTLGDDIAARLAGVPDRERLKHHDLLLKLSAAQREFNLLPFDDRGTTMSAERLAARQKGLQLETELKLFENQLRQKYPTPSREAGAAETTPEQALALLGPNEVAISFLLGSRESYAVSLSRGAGGPQIHIEVLPGRGDLADDIETLLDPVVMDQAMGRQLGERLHDKLLAPFGDRLAGKDLLILPTGPLCRLPFELLLAPGTNGRQYLGATTRIRYAPSLAVLRLLGERPRGLAQRPVWVMANPTATAEKRLPHAEAEANQIAVMMKAKPEDVFNGTAATKSKLLKASTGGVLKQYRVLHFAVHALVEAEIGSTPGLVLGDDKTLPGSGFLDMYEIAMLDLNAELVVLSACRSGGGRIYNGEGIRGLVGAFFAAGSRTAVCTHWPVEDVAASKVMTGFYRHWQSGRSAASSLFEARREAIARGDPASAWAAFVAIGY